MLYFGFEEAGLDVIPNQATQLSQAAVQMDVRQEEIRYLPTRNIDELLQGVRDLLASTEQAKITALDFYDSQNRDLSLEFKPRADSTPKQRLVRVMELLWQRRDALPWKTVVFDSVTGFQDVILSHIAQVNPGAMNDARIWASQTGEKVKQAVASLTSYNTHVVIIMPSFPRRRESILFLKL